MDFREWEASVPRAIKNDALWKTIPDQRSKTIKESSVDYETP
jgi:hypothetical protein